MGLDFVFFFLFYHVTALSDEADNMLLDNLIIY